MIKLRKLTEAEVEFDVSYEQDDAPVRGNAQVSDDGAADKQVEDEILENLERGNAWAWCTVRVKAKWHEFEGLDVLGCVRAAKEDDLEEVIEEHDMKANALENLNEQIEHSRRTLEKLTDLNGGPDYTPKVKECLQRQNPKTVEPAAPAPEPAPAPERKGSYLKLQRTEGEWLAELRRAAAERDIAAASRACDTLRLRFDWTYEKLSHEVVDFEALAEEMDDHDAQS